VTRSAAARSTTRPRAAFVGVTYAGWSTRNQNLERHVLADGRLDASFHPVTGWQTGGLVERLPIPSRVRGKVRATLEARSLAALPRPDVVWTSGRELLLPYVPAFRGPFARPLVVELDWTLDQQEQMAPWYYGRPPRTGTALARARRRQRTVFSCVSLFTPMSEWAADGLRAAGVEDDRIRVLHPGVDLDGWTFTDRARRDAGPLRLLFVGGDLRRKGGDLVIEAVAGPFAGRVVADLVTRDDVPTTAGVTVHRCEPNSPELMARFAAADLFVMPTRADCFGHAIVEAMASGLPAIVGDVGGVREIIGHGSTGWRVTPDRASFQAALAEAIAARSRLPEMGALARRDAEKRFDGCHNDRMLVDAMVELVARHRRSAGKDLRR